ncbi:MAG TPA: ZIP family metal transporter [Terriglobia bacterium]|nr:ZIP family metal transporter [Terriglobia bacterium]
MSTLLLSLLFALAAAAANILGSTIVTSQKWAQRSLRYFIAVGSGFMMGTIFLEMIPEIMKAQVKTQTSVSWPALLLIGYLIVHFFEHTFTAHMHFGEETHHEEMNPAVGFSALVGMLVHTFFDGVTIGAGFMISQRVGILLFLAVFLHKIVDGFTIASIVVSSGYSAARAMGASVLLAIATLIGVVAVHTWGSADYALPITAGCTLYIAATDLMPEVNQEVGVRMAVLVFAGMGLFLLVSQIAPG